MPSYGASFSTFIGPLYIYWPYYESRSETGNCSRFCYPLETRPNILVRDRNCETTGWRRGRPEFGTPLFSGILSFFEPVVRSLGSVRFGSQLPEARILPPSR